MSNKDTLCAVPWMHLNFEPNGKVVPCCLTSYHDYFAGDLNEQTIEEIWNSDNMKQLRREMIAGEEPKICSTCFDREKVTGESGRIYHNREFKSVVDKIPAITEPDGTCTTMELKYWDFRFSNLCNLKCRSCGPRYSSAWVPDAKKLGYTDQEKVWNIEAVDNKTNFDFLKDQVQHVEKVYFAGGEPLMMPEHWDTLDLLVENKRFDVKISYNTNASILSYGKKNALDYWRQWEAGKIEVWPSIDEIGERAELIRSGTVWPKVEANLKELASLDNITVRPGLTIGAWNVFRLPEIINHLIDIGVVCAKHKHQNFFINLLQHPEHYHVSILPSDFREEIIAKLENFIKSHNAKYNTSIDHLFTHILHELHKPYDKMSAEKFLIVTADVDEVRNEKLFDVVPEMIRVKAAITNPAKQYRVIPIVQVAEEKPHDPNKPPNNLVYKDKALARIDNRSESLMLTWVINNICTNHCVYCPEALHSGTNHNYEWEHAEKFIKECFEKYKNIHCSVSGGEPTVSPFFKDFVNLIYDNGGTIHLTTNLVRPMRYWENFATKFCSIGTSYHPEFITTAEQEDEFIAKANYVATQTRTVVRVMMLPDRWDQCYNFYKKVVEKNTGFAVEMVKILPNFGVGKDYCVINYTAEQERILNTTEVQIIPTVYPETIRELPEDSRLVFNTGKTMRLDHRISTFMSNNDLTNFENWSCDIGLESLFVHYDGNIMRGNCGVGGVIGSILDLPNVKWPTESILCNKDMCHCVADLLMSKRKYK